MPTGDIYELKVVQVLYGQARTSRLYFEQGGDDDPALNMADELIDSFEVVAGPLDDWRLCCSDRLTFICFSAVRVLPTPGVAETQFGSAAGLSPTGALPPKSNGLISFYAKNAGGQVNRKTRSRIWMMGVPLDQTNAGRILPSQNTNYQAFIAGINQFPWQSDGLKFWNHYLVTSRSTTPGEIGKPLTADPRNHAEVRPRIYNLRNSTLNICGAG